MNLRIDFCFSWSSNRDLSNDIIGSRDGNSRGSSRFVELYYLHFIVDGKRALHAIGVAVWTRSYGCT
jgi:hypothetical protein